MGTVILPPMITTASHVHASFCSTDLSVCELRIDSELESDIREQAPRLPLDEERLSTGIVAGIDTRIHIILYEW